MGLPRVKVPVLSRITVLSLCEISSASPFLISIPNSAPLPIPVVTAVGVASPKAQGHAITKTAIRVVKEKRRGFPSTKYHTVKDKMAIARTTGIK